MQGTACALKQIVDWLKIKGRDGFRIDQSLVILRLLHRVQKAGCSLPQDGLQINLDKLLRIE